MGNNILFEKHYTSVTSVGFCLPNGDMATLVQGHHFLYLCLYFPWSTRLFVDTPTLAP